VTVPFRTVVADVPWRFNDSLPGKSRGASRNYATLPLAEIKSFLADRPEIVIAPDALLFFWRVSAMVPEAYEVVEAWGFKAKSEIVWSKKTASGLQHFGMGRFVRAAHETCIIAKRGGAAVRDKSVRSVFEAPTGRHSEKPDEFFRIVERLGEGPFLELFGRKRRPGWTVLGDEIDEAACRPPAFDSSKPWPPEGWVKQGEAAE
jgi:N6-adenosine-specific RNA methylase IME4